ncbi:unnamed protein product, partial [Mesorhabditis spiculigera]
MTAVAIQPLAPGLGDDDITGHLGDPIKMLPTPVMAVLAVPATVIILLTVFGNLLVLCFKAKVGRTNTTLLVWNLGLTDFLVGIFVLPLGAFHLIYRKWIFGRALCRLWVAADVTFCTCSVVTICVISVDRYLAVTRPLRYKSVVTKCKVILVMITIWTFSSSVLLTTVRWDNVSMGEGDNCFAGNEIRYLAHSVVFAFFLPASVTLTLYWRIYKLARNRQKALDKGFLMILGQNMNFLTNTLSQQTTLRVHFGKKNGMVEHQRRVLRTHERIAKTLGVVSCSFLFCWLPFFILYLFNFKCANCIPGMAIDLASWLGYCNSMLNPIIYSFTVKEFKRSAQRFVLPLWKALYSIVPFCLPVPPESVRSRMSRTGGKMAKEKTNSNNNKNGKLLAFELKTNVSGVLRSKISQKRRLTEPAVYSVGKRVELVNPCEEPIIEEDEDAIHELSEAGWNSSCHSPWKNSTTSRTPKTSTCCRPPLPLVLERESFSNGSLPSNGHARCSNGSARGDEGSTSPLLSVMVICDTPEADV